MGSKMFTADLRKVYRLALRFEKKEPQLLRWAIARMLNDMAFKARALSINVINRHMTVRNRGFVKKQIRFGRTTGRLPVAAQESWMGTQAIKGTTGWVEQEFGVKPEQAARHGLLSRGKNKRRRVMKGRQRTGKAHTAGGFPGGSQIQRETVMLAQLRLWGEPSAQFIMDGGGLMARGIYGFDKRFNPVWLSTIDKAPRTRRMRWLSMTRNRLMLSYPVMKKFKQEYINQLQRRLG